MANDSGFKLDINFDQFRQQLSKISGIENIFLNALDVVAVQAYSEAVRLAQNKLRSNRNLYLENLIL